MKKIDKKFAQEIIEKIKSTLKKVGDEFQVNINLEGNIKFTEEDIRTKLRIKTLNATPDHVKSFEREHKWYKFESDMLNHIFKYQNDTYKFLGFSPRKRKHIALIKNIKNDKEYNMDETEVLRLIKAERSIHE